MDTSYCPALEMCGESYTASCEHCPHARWNLEKTQEGASSNDDDTKKDTVV